MALAVVTQLRALAAVVENRPFIVRDHGCLPGLVSFLRDDDEQVVFTALETLNFLAQLESNCTPMINEPGLLIQVAALKISPIERLSELAMSIYTALEPHIVEEKPIINCNTNSVVLNEVDKQENDTTIETTFTTTTTTTTTKEVKIKTGKPVPTSSAIATITGAPLSPISTNSQGTDAQQAASKPRVKRRAKTYTIYVLALSKEADRANIEAALIKVKGVVSFLIDISEKKVVVRSMTSGEKLIDAISESGYEGTFNKPETDIAPAVTPARKYLEEEDENAVSNNYGIITQEQAASMSKNAPDNNGGWFGWGSRITRALWG